MTTASAPLTATIAVIGGSGFYHLLDHAEDLTVTTPYGQPSDVISVGTVNGRPVAFLVIGPEESVTQDEVFRVFAENTERLKAVILHAVDHIPDRRHCRCPAAPDGAALPTAPPVRQPAAAAGPERP
jgi:purine nucleoside phosphorylase